MIKKLLSRFRRKKEQLREEEVINIASEIITETAPPQPPKKKRKYNKLTREELWGIICDKHKFLKNFGINQTNYGDVYIKRENIWNFFVELKLNTSNRLTEEQKDKIKREIVNRI